MIRLDGGNLITEIFFRVHIPFSSANANPQIYKLSPTQVDVERKHFAHICVQSIEDVNQSMFDYIWAAELEKINLELSWKSTSLKVESEDSSPGESQSMKSGGCNHGNFFAH